MKGIILLNFSLIIEAMLIKSDPKKSGGYLSTHFNDRHETISSTYCNQKYLTLKRYE